MLYERTGINPVRRRMVCLLTIFIIILHMGLNCAGTGVKGGCDRSSEPSCQDAEPPIQARGQGQENKKDKIKDLPQNNEKG